MNGAAPDPHARRRSRRARLGRFARTFVVVFALVGGLRLALPSLVKRYVERVLDDSAEYDGSIGGLDLNLWRGAYELTDVDLRREGSTAERPFVDVERADISVQWSALVRGHVVTEIVLHHPRVEFVSAASGGDAQTGEDGGWAERIGRLAPFHIDRFVMRDGEVRFTHEGVEPPVDLFVTDAFLEVLNLTNQRQPESDEEYMAELEAAGRPFGTGEFEARLRFDALADEPRFELDALLTGIEMVELNDFLQAYGNVDAEDGTLEVYAEFAASDGRIEGYVKTLIEGLELASLDEIDDPVDALQTLWEGFVELGAELLENQPRDRLAVRVPLRGELGNTDTDLVAVVGSLLRNAFVAALRPAIDETIELDDVRIARLEKVEDER